MHVLSVLLEGADFALFKFARSVPNMMPSTLQVFVE